MSSQRGHALPWLGPLGARNAAGDRARSIELLGEALATAERRGWVEVAGAAQTLEAAMQLRPVGAQSGHAERQPP
jgi:hypothetical protein